MLMKFTSMVNFINSLSPAFALIFFRQTVIGKNTFVQKDTRKMLVKFVDFTNILRATLVHADPKSTKI